MLFAAALKVARPDEHGESVRRGSIRAARVAHPVARTRAKARGSISWVRESTLVQRQTAATDASRQPRSKALKLRDAFVNAACPTAGKFGPVLTLGNPALRELREFYRNFIEGHADPLGEDNKRNPSKHDSLISAVARAGPLGLDQTLLLVKTQRRRGHPTAARNLTDCKRIRHTQRNITISS